MSRTFRVALIHDVFFENEPERRLRARLAEAAALGAELAVLPEIPLNPWSPATTTAREEDAEDPGGRRHRMLAEAALEARIGVLGGAIVRDPETGARRNTALVYDAAGQLLATYAKLHIPEEPGFWETSHYEPGVHPPRPIAGFSMPFGVQICSDINRPEGSHLLGAQGALAILAPRATEAATWERWRVVLQANALTSCAYLLSVNRPGPEQGVLIGGPSFAVAPNGRILVESVDPVVVAELEAAVVEQAQRDYPGYLPVRSALYAQAWAKI